MERIEYLREKNKDVDYNIFKALDNINLNSFQFYNLDHP